MSKKGKYPITPEMAEEIRRVYLERTGENQVNELAAKLRLPRWKVSQFAILQGWTQKRFKEPDWSEREIRILGMSAHRGPEVIQRYLKKVGFKRSVTGIVLKRKRLRLLQNLNGQSATGLCECFGVDVKVITRWIHLGYLRAMKRGTKRTEVQGGDEWFIRDSWVREFVINNLDIIDFRKVDKWWVVDLLVGDRNEALRERDEEDDPESHVSNGVA